MTSGIRTHDSTNRAMQAVNDHCDHLLGILSETNASFEGTDE